MTITNRAMNDRLTNLERCAEIAPDRTHEDAKAVARIVGDLSNMILRTVRDGGLVANNSDGLRNLEAAIYGYIVASNPGAAFLTAAEGFGEHVDGPAGARVLAQAIRDRNALEGMAS